MTPSLLAFDIARKVNDCYARPFGRLDTVAREVDAVLLPRLAAHADKLRDAAMVPMCLMDDAGEAMAMAIEDLFGEALYARDHPQLAAALAGWRKMRPTRGLAGGDSA